MLVIVTLTDIGCVVRATIGIPCPGCGQTRAFTYFFSGEFAKAFFYHPLFLLTPICTLLIAFEKPNGEMNSKVKKFFLLCIFLYVGTYIIRMILLFPDTAPMTINENAPLYKLFIFLIGK